MQMVTDGELLGLKLMLSGIVLFVVAALGDFKTRRR